MSTDQPMVADAADTDAEHSEPAETRSEPEKTACGSSAGEDTPDDTDGPEPDAAESDGAGTSGTETAETESDGSKDPNKPTDPVAPADPWTAFGPPPERTPSWPRRTVGAVGRAMVHEWTLAALACLALAVLMTWPTLRYPAYTIPQDTWDPSLQAWQMAWSGHILLVDPAQLWHANAFFPERWSFAFSDTLLGYAPAGMIGHGPTAAVIRYNIMFVLAHALATFGAYALARQLGAGRMGAAVAGASYAYAPWLLAQAGHLHVISNGAIPLALAMLARGHGWSLRHGYRPQHRRIGWALAGWLVATWQISLGFGIGLPFAYILGLIALVVVVVWLVRRALPRAVKRPFGVDLLIADLVGMVTFAAAGAWLAVPYFRVTELHPYAKRSIAEVAFFSPPLSGFFTAPAESWLWGDAHAQARQALPFSVEMTLLPGFVLYALASAGLVLSIWTLRQRLLLLGGVLVTGALAMGTRFFGGTYTYVPLFEHLPGWEGLRTPGRLMLWTTLLLGILAAGAVSAFVERIGEFAWHRLNPWPGPGLRVLMSLPLVLVLVEGVNVTPHPIVPAQPAAMRTVDGPMLVLPSDPSRDQHVMLWSTSRFQPIVNGGSGFTPHRLDEIRKVTATFPDAPSVDYLRRLGVKTVLLLPDRAGGTPWQAAADAPVDGLGINREQQGGAIVFRL